MGKARTSASGSVKRNTKLAPALRSETAGKILDLAEELIQTRGCSAFSYQDIADALKIRKASIHYHFETKADLVTAVIDRYTEKFEQAMKNIASDESASSMSMLEHYVRPYAAFAATPDRVCLCGALSGKCSRCPANCASVSGASSSHINGGWRKSWNGARRAANSGLQSPPERPLGLSSAHYKGRS